MDWQNYDPRLGRFLSVDPLVPDFPWNSPYAFAKNDVIRSRDLEGAEKGETNKGMCGGNKTTNTNKGAANASNGGAAPGNIPTNSKGSTAPGNAKTDVTPKQNGGSKSYSSPKIKQKLKPQKLIPKKARTIFSVVYNLWDIGTNYEELEKERLSGEEREEGLDLSWLREDDKEQETIA